MIVADRKPIEEILEMIAGAKRVLVLGCGSCVAVCLSGGEKQADELASGLRLWAKVHGVDMQVDSDTIRRQCDREFVETLQAPLDSYDVVISIACGVGVQFMGDQFPAARVVPGLNTTFYGASSASGVWVEYCHGCGQCVLAWTGGICPMARCAKNLINGTCGGTNHGKCEVSKEMDCAWYLIYKRLEVTGRLDQLRKMRDARDWRLDRGGGVRRLTHAELMDEENPK